ncbi:MAG: hypothetical protein KIS92_20120 [Planctomycetota bacterium]|nr:hypothetical protein [Planctomycetota bacterium]
MPRSRLDDLIEAAQTDLEVPDGQSAYPYLQNPRESEPEEEGIIDWLKKVGIGGLAGAGLGGGLGLLLGGPAGAVTGALWGAGFGGAGATDTGDAVLGALARPTRTLLHTHDFGKAVQSIYDREQASSTEDLLRDVGYRTTVAGPSRTWGTAVGDFLANSAVGVITDPATYLGVGAFTKAGNVTKSIGMEAQAMLRKVGPEGAAEVAKFFNGAATSAERTLGKALPRIAELTEGADSAMIQAHAEHVQDFLGNFGLGKTFRQRLKMGQQTLVGYHLWPFGGEQRSILGAEPEAAAMHGFKDTLQFKNVESHLANQFWGQAIGPDLEVVRTPFADYATNLQAGSKIADWMGEVADTVSAAARATPLGRKALDLAEATREFFLNPDDRDAVGNLIRTADSKNAVAIQDLERQHAEWTKLASKYDLDTRADMVELLQYKGPADRDPNATIARERVETATARMRQRGMTEEQMKEVGALVDSGRKIAEQARVLSGESGSLGDTQRQRLAELEKTLGLAEMKWAQQQEAEYILANTRREFEQAETGVSDDAAQLKNKAAQEQYDAQVAEGEHINSLKAGRDYTKERLFNRFGTEEGGQILDRLDRVGAAWQKDSGAESLNEWYVQHAPLMTTDEMKVLSCIKPKAGEVYTRERWGQDLRTQFKLNDDQADAVVAVTDARANAWAKTNGGTPEDWYQTRLKGVEREEVTPAGVTGEGHSKARVHIKEDGQAIIKAFQKADVASALHEVGHIMRHDLPAADLKIVEEWTGIKDGMWLREATAKYGAGSAEAKAAREAEEMFARGFERYLQSGEAPNDQLKSIFAKLRDWFTEIYQGIVGSGKIRMDEDVKAVYDRLLGGAEVEGAVSKAKVESVVPKVEGPTGFMVEKLKANGWTDEQIGRLSRDDARAAIAKKLPPPDLSKLGLSDQDLAVFKSLGWSDAQLADLTQQEAAKMLDAHKAGEPGAIKDMRARVFEGKTVGGVEQAGTEDVDELRRFATEKANPEAGMHGGAREGAGRPANPEPTPEQRAEGDEFLRRQRAQQGDVARLLRRSLSDQDRLVLNEAYGLPGDTLTNMVKKHGADSVQTKAAAASEAAFEHDWHVYQRGLGFQVPEQVRPIFQKMQRWADNAETNAIPAKPITRNAPTPPKPKLLLNVEDRKGVLNGWQKTWTEYRKDALDAWNIKTTEHGFKASEEHPGAGLRRAEVVVDSAALRKAHVDGIKRAITNGYYVPTRVIEDYATHPDYQRMLVDNAKNLRRLRKDQVLSSVDVLYEKKQALRKAQKEYDKTGKFGDLTYVKELRAEVAEQRELVANMPDHVQLYFTPEAIAQAQKNKLFGATAKTGTSAQTMERKIHEHGRYIGPKEINEMLVTDPQRVAGMVALGGEAPKADLTLQQFVKVFNTDRATLEAVGQKVGKTADELAKMKRAEYLAYFQQAFAKVFDERPEVLLAANVEAAARTRNMKDFDTAGRNLFSKPLKPLENPIEQAMLSARRQQLYDLQARVPDAETKTALAKITEEVASGHSAVDPGWVDASALGKEWEGRQVKREVYKKILAWKTSISNPSWMQGGFMKTMTRTTQIWKRMQVAWPGSHLRNWVGDLMLRFQNDGWHPESTANVVALSEVLASHGDPDILKNVNLTIGGKRVDAARFWKDAMEQGTIGHNFANAELKRTLTEGTKAGERGILAKTADVWTREIPEFMQNWERLSMFHSRLVKGDSVEAAGAAVDAALYNYKRVSPFVDMARKTGLMPFATWASKNVPAQLELLVTRPGQFAALLHARQAIQAGVPGVDERNLPAYLKDKFNVVYERDQEGKVHFLTANGLIPMVDVPYLLDSGMQEYFEHAFGPIPKALAEQVFNRDMFTKHDIERFDGEMGILELPGSVDVPIPVRTKAFLKTTIGRPLTFLESAAGLANETVDPKLNRPRNFLEARPVVSGLLGVVPQIVDPTAEILEKRQRLQQDLQRTLSAARRWRAKGVPAVAVRLEKQAQDLQAQMSDLH